MNKIKGNFFEEHVEKIVLIVFCVLCMAILVMGVLLSPNSVSYDGKKLGPADIDNYIAGNARSLNDKLNEPAAAKEPYASKLGEFSRLIDSSTNINVSYDFDMPKLSDIKPHDNTKYDLPTVGSLGSADAEHIRAVAYVPTNTVTLENPYSAENSQPGDIDFVTVQSQIDISRLNNSFNDAFGANPLAVLQDPCLVRPIFAAVELQRQQLKSDGSWSDWLTVARTKVDSYKETLQVIENINALGNGGMKVRMLQFNNISLQMALLQPDIYRFASADENWLPPVLHRQFAKMQKDELIRTKRLEREAETLQKQQQEEEKRKLRLERAAANNPQAPDAVAVAGDEEPVAGRLQDRNLNNPNLNNRTVNNPRNPRNRTINNPEVVEPVVTEQVPPLENFIKKMDEIRLTETTNFAQMNKPIVFWAHDDTVEPGKTYHYRIRIGVFNPLAGTDKLKEDNKSLKDKVILWSDFADVQQTVTIPGRTYFFASEMIENSNSVKVEVCKYISGYWYSQNVTVRPGEVIGTSGTETINDISQTVDYSTGAVLVDLTAVNEWTNTRKNMQPTRYYQMVYSFKDSQLQFMPIKAANWPDKIRNDFNMIKELQKAPQKPLRPFEGGADPINNPDAGYVGP